MSENEQVCKFPNSEFTVIKNDEEHTLRVIITDEDKNVVDDIIDCYEANKKCNENPTTKTPWTLMVDLKKCSVERKAEVMKVMLHCDDLEDPLMLLNIFNLVKMYNTLDDGYFDSPDTYVNSVEELLDLKLALSEDIKDFSRRLSIYFLSILKSYNKMIFTPVDDRIVLPKAFEAIILASDLTTLSGIFAKATNISTEDLVYVDNAYLYMTSLINKGITTAGMLGEFLEANEVQ